MKRYATLLIGWFLGLCASLAAFVLLVDPYDVLHGPRISGFNTNKTRRDEDGRRVTVGQLVMERGHGTLLFGNSRAVDGFPRAMSDAEWPGGLINAGIRASGPFEQTRAAVLAGRSPDLRCVVMTFDYGSFAVAPKAKSTYWISALPDGNATAALFRTALSPHAFWRSVQTISDNIAGRPDKDRWPDTYPPGEQRRRYLNGARGYVASYRSLEFDETRLDFMMTGLAALAEHGVQVIGVLYPLHAWHEEAMVQTGKMSEADGWRAELTERFAELAANTPIAPCAASRAGAVLWDFTGFQMAPYSFPPAEDATGPQPYFYEAAHFTPLVGVAVLNRIAGRPLAPPFNQREFGVALTPKTVSQRVGDERTLRAQWLSDDPNAQMIESKIAAWMKTETAESHGPRDPLSRDDWAALRRDITRLARH